jgi:hypothetical protein
MSFERRGALSATRAVEAVTEPAGWHPPRWVVPLFGLAALLLVPWVVLLVVALPSAHRAAHWDIAWAGFDVVLALLLLTVATAAWRRSPWLEGAATASATLLFVDAWFDVLTASTRTEFVVSIGEATFVELPLAILCLLLAREAERRLRVPLLGNSASAPPASPSSPPHASWAPASHPQTARNGRVLAQVRSIPRICPQGRVRR